nr:MAG TPA: hypothetical protein [Caudoviricetes sp.]
MALSCSPSQHCPLVCSAAIVALRHTVSSTQRRVTLGLIASSFLYLLL